MTTALAKQVSYLSSRLQQPVRNSAFHHSPQWQWLGGSSAFRPSLQWWRVVGLQRQRFGRSRAKPLYATTTSYWKQHFLFFPVKIRTKVWKKQRLPRISTAKMTIAWQSQRSTVIPPLYPQALKTMAGAEGFGYMYTLIKVDWVPKSSLDKCSALFSTSITGPQQTHVLPNMFGVFTIILYLTKLNTC